MPSLIGISKAVDSWHVLHAEVVLLDGRLDHRWLLNGEEPIRLGHEGAISHKGLLETVQIVVAKGHVPGLARRADTRRIGPSGPDGIDIGHEGIARRRAAHKRVKLTTVRIWRRIAVRIVSIVKVNRPRPVVII